MLDVEATTLIRRSGARSRNPTFHLLAALPSGTEVSVVVKPSMPLDGHFFEWAGAELGRRLGILVPDSFCVSITDSFRGSIAAEDQNHFSAGRPSYGALQFVGLDPPVRPLHESIRQSAAELLAFDVFLQNADRRDTNPNFMVSREGLMAFDHELMCSDRYLFGPAKDDPCSLLDNHWCTPEVPKNSDFSAFRARIAALSDQTIEDVIAEGTGRWPISFEAEIASALRKRRDSAPEWLERMKAWLR